jgi:hypothetical protein
MQTAGTIAVAIAPKAAKVYVVGSASGGTALRMSRSRGSRVGAPDAIKVAFDSRPCVEVRGVGRYSRGLLGGLESVAGEGIEIVETHRPRHVDVYHSPWIDGAILRSPCPMVVSIHDVDALTRPSERLRCGGVYLRLRHLALARATHAIVPSEAVAEDAVARLGLEHGRVVVIPPAGGWDVTDARAGEGAPTRISTPADPGDEGAQASSWSWEDVARATWRVYERALSEPGRAFVSTPPAASTRLESS